MKIAIVEDDINVRKSLEIAMSDYPQFEIETFKNPQDALKKLNNSFDLIVTDLNMPKIDGIDFIKKLNGKFSVIVITGNATLQSAVESLKLGVKDFIIKPFNIERLIESIEKVEVQENITFKKVIKKQTKKVDNRKDDFLSSSPELNKILDYADRSAKTDATIMLLGESGVGKEVVAKYIHKQSKRANKSFIALNMASIPENLLESELFGYEKGAFTDATSSKEGYFELANGGTIFLDEIGEMPYQLQAKILRVIQEREVRRLGSKTHIPIDIRIISATNQNIRKNVFNEKFRKDLYFRLNTIILTIPPLRNRKNEILEIAEKSLEKFCKKYDFALKSFSEDAKFSLLNHSWQGNIRELLSVVERASILTEQNIIKVENLFLEEFE